MERHSRAGTFSYMSTDIKSPRVVRAVALETSGRSGSLAAVKVEGSRIEFISKIGLPHDQRTAQSLLPTLEKMFSTIDWQIDNLDMIGATTGPGSFTGLRVGVTTAKALAYATGAMLVGVHTLAAIAAGCDSESASVWTILDAQRQELFAARFEPGWQNKGGTPPETLVIGIDDWLAELQVGDVVSGPPLKMLEDRLPGEVRVADAKDWYPTAEVVARLAVADFERGAVVDPMQLIPHYYRKSAAEEKADANRQETRN